MTCAFLFIGPTLAACQTSVDLDNYQLQPPAQRGSITAVVEAHATPGVIILVDGAIENSLAVSHRELLLAAQAGWQVWGLADMGAIRAWEMRDCGIHGFGDVYQQLQQQSQLRDDEILWSYCPETPYQRYNEPMIHLAKALYHLQQQGHLSVEQNQQVTEQLQQSWYKHRTIALLIQLVQQYNPTIDQAALTVLSADFSGFQSKQQDFLRFVAEKPWL